MTVDPFVLRGAAVGAAWRAERGGAAGAVYHAVGGGPLPIASGLPVVVTLLDLAPWELPGGLPALDGEPLRPTPPGADPARGGGGHRRQRGDGPGRPPAAADPARPAARRRPRAAGRRSARRARRPVRRRRDRPRCATRLGAPGAATSCCSGRFDARLDLATLLDALEPLAAAGPARRPRGGRRLAAAGPARRRQPGRPRRRSPARPRAGGSATSFAYAPGLSVERAGRPRPRRARRRSSRSLSEAAGLPVIEALACGTPVVASAVGPLPELVGAAGLLVEPRDPDRLAVALATIWADDAVHAGIAALAGERAEARAADVGRRRARDAGDLRRGRRHEGLGPGAVTERSTATATGDGGTSCP